MSQDPWRDQQKHLEFIEMVITRQASNSFLTKGWAITVCTGTYGFAIQQRNWKIAGVGMGAAIMFWILDAYYLRQERLFRILYRAVLDPKKQVARFDMATERFANEAPMSRALFSPSLIVLYLALITGGVLVQLSA